MDFRDVSLIFSRWLHISSAAVLLGSAVLAVGPLARAGHIGVLAAFRGTAVGAIVLLAATGLYNILSKAAVPPGYHAMFGLKMLLALHVLAVTIIATGASLNDARRKRLLTGVISSGFAIVLISGYLRWLSQ